jgi:uncharacterized membrane protein
VTSKFMLVFAAYLHALGIAAYLGGSVVMEFVLGPAQKAIPPAQAQVMGEKTADRFLVLAWSALGVIGASGVLRLFTMRSESLLAGEDLFSTQYGRTLFVMELLWVALVVNGAVITFVLRPRLKAKLGAGTAAPQVEAGRQRLMQAATWITRLTRVDLAIALVVALLGASLKFGGIVG